MQEHIETTSTDQQLPVPPSSQVSTPGAARSDRLGIALSLLALYLIWGSTYFAIRIAISSIPPMLMVGARFVLAGGLLFALLKARGAPTPTWRQWRGSLIVGTFLCVGGMGGVALAEQWVASSVAAFCIATTPLWISLFSGLFGRWPSRHEWIGLVIGLAGVVCLNIGNNLWATPLGAALLVLAPICWTFGSAWSHRLSLPKGLMESAAEMMMGGAVALQLGLVIGERPTGSFSWQSLAAFAYLTVIGSMVAYTAYGFLLRRVRPALATSYAYVNPLVAVCLGVAFGGDRITPVGIVGMVVILAGVVLVSLARGRAIRITTSSTPAAPGASSPSVVQAESGQ